jgi:hypothetical protein
MNELIKLWSEFKEKSEVCICGMETLTKDGEIYMYRHKDYCGKKSHIDTDIGTFLNWLSYNKKNI